LQPSSVADIPILIAAALLFLGLLASRVGGRWGLPGLLLFLAVGMLAGSDGPGGIWFDNYALAQGIGVVALTFILFSGGLSTRWSDARPILARGLSLATLGVLVTAGLVGWAAQALFDMPWAVALLLGSVVASTDASAVFAVLRERGVSLNPRVRNLLEFESGVNDPMAIFLVLGFTALATAPQTTPLDMVGLFFQQMLVGGLLGYILGFLAVWAFRQARLGSDGLYAVLSVALVGLVYGITANLGGSGFLAVYVTALVLGNSSFAHKRALRSFHEGLTYLLEMGMFLILGLLVFPAQLPAVAIPALLLALFLMLVARPIAVWLSLGLARMNTGEKALVAWVGLRGGVPVILATFPLLAGLPQAQLIFNVAFFIVLVNVLVQGSTLALAARFLGQSDPPAVVGKHQVE
jgi:cell volume regulation protein A